MITQAVVKGFIFFLVAEYAITRGSAFVTEYQPRTGQVRSWNECYNQKGNVNRVHPKTLDGQTLRSQHYPLTKNELRK